MSDFDCFGSKNTSQYLNKIRKFRPVLSLEIRRAEADGGTRVLYLNQAQWKQIFFEIAIEYDIYKWFHMTNWKLWSWPLIYFLTLQSIIEDVCICNWKTRLNSRFFVHLQNSVFVRNNYNNLHWAQLSKHVVIITHFFILENFVVSKNECFVFPV